jgi:uncharacterized UPF0160 family protein
MAKKVVTHSGKYHSDDVFAVATLELAFPAEELNIIRTRLPDVIAIGDIVVDVGGVYDEETFRFDHHQIGGAGKRDNGIPYASFGLVWKKFGEQITGSKDATLLIDAKLVQPIDAGDNGVETCVPNESGVAPYTIQTALNAFRSTWKEDIKNDEVFIGMVALAKRILSREVEIANSYLEASEVVRTVYDSSERKDLLIFGKDHHFGREVVNDVLSTYPGPMYAVLYGTDQDSWQVVAINKNPMTMEIRRALPKTWRGKRDSELAEASGIADAIFCHSSGFMAKAKSLEGTIALAEKALL